MPFEYFAYFAVKHCELGINVASTVSLELCMFDKPVVNVGYNPPNVAKEKLSYSRYYRFDHYAPVVASGAVKVAESLRHMEKLVRDALASPKDGHNQCSDLLKRFFSDTLDGQSGLRTSEVLLHLVKSHV